jgi:hypothetical protein
LNTNVYWGDKRKEKAWDTIQVLAAIIKGLLSTDTKEVNDNFWTVLREAQVDITVVWTPSKKSAVRTILHNTTQQHWQKMQFKLSRLTRIMMTQTNYNATIFNDAIVINLATLASRHFGAPKEVAANAQTLKEAFHHLYRVGGKG